MAMKIPIPDTQPGVDWKVAYNESVTFQFNRDVDHFQVDHPEFFTPKVQPGPHKAGDTITTNATTRSQKVAFKYHPDTSATLAATHTILIGN
jgi:hypothetical protein